MAALVHKQEDYPAGDTGATNREEPGTEQRRGGVGHVIYEILGVSRHGTKLGI
jgi:hypothetical protein